MVVGYLKILGKFRGKLSAMFASKANQVKEIFGQIEVQRSGLRACLLWAPGCQFSKSDLELAAYIFSDKNSNSCIVINCECKDYSSHAKLLDLAELVVVRENQGYDWGAYKDLLLNPLCEPFKYVTIINNSIHLIGSKNDWIRQQELLATSCDGVSGVVESAYPFPHLQSFALTFTKTALSSDLRHWLEDIKYTNNKFFVVDNYEVGLSKILNKLNIPLKAILPYATFYPWVEENWVSVLGPYSLHPKYLEILTLLRNNLSINPTHALWRFIHAKGIPITKNELMIKNPIGMPDLFLIKGKAYKGPRDPSSKVIRPSK